MGRAMTMEEWWGLGSGTEPKVRVSLDFRLDKYKADCFDAAGNFIGRLDVRTDKPPERMKYAAVPADGFLAMYGVTGLPV